VADSITSSVRSSTEFAGRADRLFSLGRSDKNGALGPKQPMVPSCLAGSGSGCKKHQALTTWLETDGGLTGASLRHQRLSWDRQDEDCGRRMNALKQAQPTLPIAYFNCVESKSDQADDLLLTITEELAADATATLGRLERRGRCRNLQSHTRTAAADHCRRAQRLSSVRLAQCRKRRHLLRTMVTNSWGKRSTFASDEREFDFAR